MSLVLVVLPEGEPFPTVRTRKGLLARVDPLVLSDVGELVELFAAVRTLVLLRAGVRALVLVHMADLFEALVAEGTLVGMLAGIQRSGIGLSIDAAQPE